MLKFVAVITTHAEKWYDIAKAWEKDGAPGVTIIDSHGLQRVHQKAKVELQPMGSFSMATILRKLQPEDTSRVIFSIVAEELVDTLIASAEKLVDLEAPDTGIAFVLDVDRVVGLQPPKEE